MVERISVNGCDVDLSNEHGLSICIKSNILEKTSDFSSCYSYTYDLPMTTNNKAIFGELLSVGDKNKRVRMFLPAEYYRDGYKIFDGKCYVSEVNTDKFSIVMLFGVNNALQQIKDEGIYINELFNNPKDDNVRTYTQDDLLAYKRFIPLTDRNQFAPYPFNSDSAYDTQVFALYDSSAGIATLTGSKLAVRAKRVFDLIRQRYGLQVETDINTKNVWLQTAQNNRKDKFVINFPLTNSWRGAGNDYEINLIPMGYDQQTNMANLVYGIDYDLMNDGVTVNVIKHKYRINRVQLSLDISTPASGSICYTNVTKSTQQIGTIVTPQNTIAKWDSEHTHIEVDFKPEEMGFEYEWDATNLSNGESVFFCSAIVLISDDRSTRPSPTNVTCLMTYQLEGDNVGTGFVNSVDSLPSITITQFLQDFLFGCNGEFIVNDIRGKNKLRSINLEQMSYKQPYDWTLKIVGTDIKVYHKVDGLSKENHIKWNTSQHEARKTHNMPTNDTTLEDKEDFFTSNFGKMEGITNFTYYGGVSVIPSPKILSVAFGRSLLIDNALYAVAQNFNFNWIDLDTESWKIMQKTLSEPLRLECDVVFSSAELANLDLSRPVYFNQFGALFIIKEITITGEKGKLKLLQLKK